MTLPQRQPLVKTDPIEHLKAQVERDLHKVEYGMRRWIQSQVEALNQITRYVLDAGGKRFRPKLMIVLSYLGGQSGDKVTALAAAFEFIHTASLLHDDVVDRAELRRGRSTINAIWGNKAAILAGDFFYARACEILNQYGSPQILKIATQATAIMSEGELEQMALDAQLHLTEGDYFRMIDRKTAALMAAIGRAAGLSAELSHEKSTALESYGRHIGLAFQLSDDSLDYSALESDLGKRIGKDALDGIVTLPLLYAYRQADAGERQMVWSHIRRDESKEEDRRSLMALVEKYHGVRYTLEKAKAEAERAIRSLESFPASVERMALELLAEHAVNRLK